MFTPKNLDLLHVDDHVAAIAKPSGLLVHRGWAQDEVVALTLLRDRLGKRVYPVHRLDRPTSGVLLFALDPGTNAALQAQFAAGTVAKRYLALVRGIPPESVDLDHPVPKRPKSAERVAAFTHFRRLATFERYALMEARPRTGRLHQIRRHLKHLSHPVIGDVRYGKGDQNRLFRERFNLHRLALHALELTFEHPVSGERMLLRAPLPEDLREPFEAMGLMVDSL